MHVKYGVCPPLCPLHPGGKAKFIGKLLRRQAWKKIFRLKIERAPFLNEVKNGARIGRGQLNAIFDCCRAARYSRLRRI